MDWAWETVSGSTARRSDYSTRRALVSTVATSAPKANERTARAV